MTIGLTVAPAIAPSIPAASAETEGPIVTPAGYLVPDESPEEASDEGR